MRKADKYAWYVIAVAMLISALALACLATPVKAQRSTTIATCGVLTQGTPALGSAGIMAYDQNGSQCVSASVTASVTGFAPAGTFATLSTSGVSASVALPAGAVVVFSNTGTTAVSCTLGVGSATASASQNVIQSGSWMALTVGSNTFGACIDQTGVVANTVVLSGGSGLPTGAGGGGSGGGGGAVTIADAADVTQGGQADAACATDNGSCTVTSLLKRENQRLTTLITNLGTANVNGQATMANSSPVTIASNQTSVPVLNGGGSSYETIAASATGQTMGPTGATGDYLSHCVIYPTSTSPGVLTVFDNTSSAANNAIAFAGGATSLSNLVPFAIPVGAISVNGPWKVTTGANMVATCYGKFT